MKFQSNRTKIGRIGRWWQRLPVLIGALWISGMVIIAHIPSPPVPSPAVTPIGINPAPTPSQPILPLDLAGDHLFLIDRQHTVTLWDGIHPATKRGSLQTAGWSMPFQIMIDRANGLVIVRDDQWIEARTIDTNRRVWAISTTTSSPDGTTHIIDSIMDPTHPLVWIIEKHQPVNPFQPATVRVRSINGLNGREVRRFPERIVEAPPQILPTAYAPWFLADGHLYPLTATETMSNEPMLSQIEVAVVTNDGQHIFAFGNGTLYEINPDEQRINHQITLTEVPQTPIVSRLLISPDEEIRILVGTQRAFSIPQQHVIAYDREGQVLSSWNAPTIDPDTRGWFHEDSFRWMQFLDAHRLIMLNTLQQLCILDLRSSQTQMVTLPNNQSQPNAPGAFDGFALIPPLPSQPMIENPPLVEVPQLVIDPPMPALGDHQQPLVMLDNSPLTNQIWADGTIEAISTSTIHTISRPSLPPLFIQQDRTTVMVFDPTRQITQTLAISLTAEQKLVHITSISSSNKSAVVICYGIAHKTSKAKPQYFCLHLDLTSGDQSPIHGLASTSPLIPIYWHGAQGVIGGTDDVAIDALSVNRLWYISLEMMAQGDLLPVPNDVTKLWYSPGVPIMVYRDSQARVYQYDARDQTRHLLNQGRSESDLRADIAPDGQTIVLSERHPPSKYGTIRLIDAATKRERWHDQLIEGQQGQWSADGQFYLIKRPSTLNTRLEVINRDGTQHQPLMMSRPFYSPMMDWDGQGLAMIIDEHLYLLHLKEQQWIPRGRLAIPPSSRITYVYPFEE